MDLDDVTQLRDRLSAVQHLAGVGFWEWDIQANETVWTDSLYRIFGFEPGAFGPSYEAWMNLVHPEDRELVDRLVQQAFAERSSYAFDHRIVLPDGQVRVLHCRGQVVTDDDGNPAKISGISEDVTGKRGSEEDLRRFIADAAHELRTPVAAIEVALELIERARLDAHRDSGMAVLRRQASRLTNLTNSLLDLEAVRPDGRVGIVLAAVTLADVLREAVVAVGFPAEKNVQIDVQPSDLCVRAVVEHLERIVVLLLDNADRYGGANVAVTARPLDQTHVAVIVLDDGRGVPPDVIPNLFAPFSRGRQADGSGAGLGLAICRRLVQGLGGELTHQSPSGGGTAFRFTLELAT